MTAKKRASQKLYRKERMAMHDFGRSKIKLNTLLAAIGTCTVLGLTGCSSTMNASVLGTAVGNEADSNGTTANETDSNGAANNTDNSAAEGNSSLADSTDDTTDHTDDTNSTGDSTAAQENNTNPADANNSTDDTASFDSVVTSDSKATIIQTSKNGTLYTSDLFTDRDLQQTTDVSDAITYTVSDGKDIHITEEGVYVINGTAANSTIYIEADSEAKVQLVLDGVSITNDSFPCIYVKEADKVFVTTTGTENSLSVTGSFTADGSTNTDGVIYSKSDLVLNGTGTLTIKSMEHGIVCKDDLKVTGGTYNITAVSKAFDVNDSIRIADGTFNLIAGTDGLHAENTDDASLGYIYICGGTFTIKVGDDGIHAESAIQIDGGTFDIAAAEGIESTCIQINDGTVSIQASDDGINAANKSSAYSVMLEINGGEITVVMGAGDTDGIDSNGDIIINGGTIDVTGNSSFDYDGTAQFNGGTIIVNGQQVDTIPNQMMGGGRNGGMNGGMNGDMNGSMNGGGRHFR